MRHSVVVCYGLSGSLTIDLATIQPADEDGPPGLEGRKEHSDVVAQKQYYINNFPSKPWHTSHGAIVLLYHIFTFEGSCSLSGTMRQGQSTVTRLGRLPIPS
ncbi:hypothetical protein CC79DRAFT_1069705 [Sarocladium strictum]